MTYRCCWMLGYRITCALLGGSLRTIHGGGDGVRGDAHARPADGFGDVHMSYACGVAAQAWVYTAMSK